MTPILDREHIKKGRTFRAGVEAGNLYQLVSRSHGLTLCYWQATSPEETVLLTALKWPEDVPSGREFLIYRYLPTSQIGCSVLELCGNYIVP